MAEAARAPIRRFNVWCEQGSALTCVRQIIENKRRKSPVGFHFVAPL